MELVVSPSGRLAVRELDHADGEFAQQAASALTPRQLSAIRQAFEKSAGDGLFALATIKFPGTLPTAWEYWREFAVGYVTKLCQTTEDGSGDLKPIAPPTSAELSRMVLNVPPMRGAEYVSAAVLEELWQELDSRVREEAAGYRGFRIF